VHHLAGNTTLSLTRHFDAPPELVWKAWTDPEAMKAWLCPGDGFTAPVVESDLRVGGRYRIVMRGPDGKDYETSGTYEVIDPPHVIRYTWTWTSTPHRLAMVTVTLRPEHGGTALHLRHEGLVDELDRQNHEGGWSNSLATLARWITRAVRPTAP
jgi:uncharacterized protein YndB with AHSA1/START domain